MIAVVHRNSEQEVVEFVDGRNIAVGSIGTNGAGSTSFEDLTAGAFVGVQVGDKFYISGDATVRTVATIVDDNHITVSAAITAAHTASASWKIRRGGVGVGNILFGGPYQRDQQTWILFYDSVTFG